MFKNFFKYFVLILIVSFVSSCFLFTESGYYKGPKSDHFDGKKFFNPEFNDPIKKNFMSYYKAKAKYESENGKSKWVDNLIEVKTFNPKPQIQDKISITFVGHSTFLLQFSNLNILTDPIWSNRASPVPFLGPKRAKKPGINFDDLPKIDVVLISHSHYDHLDLPTLKNLNKKFAPKFYVGLGICHFFNKIKKLNFDCTELDWGQNTIFNENLAINFEPARHWSKRMFFGSNATLWGAFVLQTKLGNIYFAGDTGYGDHFKKAKEKYQNFELAMLPIGAYKPEDFMIRHHISPLQAVMAHKELNAKKSIAMHFETFQLASDNFKDPANELKKQLKEQNIEKDFLLLEVGENLEININKTNQK